MATPSPRRPDRAGRTVPVAILARTSTLALQDPYASLNRQITSAREWLPKAFVAGYYWDVESGGLDIEQRGHGSYDQLTAKGLPRDGGLADLLAEAKAPPPRFAAVVVEDIERSARDTYNSLKLERQLADQGIPLFATDEPADITGISPTTILVRRIKQGVAEWFRLQLKEKTWKGLKEHTPEGWNLGPVPYGYLPDRVPHPNPFKAPRAAPKPGWSWTRTGPPSWCRSTPGGPWASSGVNAIVARLNADHATYPPADPAAGWSLGGVSAILGNPKYTGYQVFGRRRRGRPVPVEQWHWSPAPAHPQIIDRANWDAAQAAGADHGSTRDGDDPNTHPATRRTYLLRSRVRCKLCQRRMCRHHPHPPRTRHTRRLRLLHLPVQPRQPPPRRRRPGPSPHRRRPPGPAAGHAAGRAGRLRAGPRPRRPARRTPPRRGRRGPGPPRRPGRRAPAPAQAGRRRRTQPDHRTEQRRRHASPKPPTPTAPASASSSSPCTANGRPSPPSLTPWTRTPAGTAPTPPCWTNCPNWPAGWTSCPNGSRPNYSPPSTSRSCGTRP